MRAWREPVKILCNPSDDAGGDPDTLRWTYLGPDSAVRVGLPRFVQDVFRLPHRHLDLLEIAAYVYAADRSVRRGSRSAVEYHSWARDFDFRVHVRDHAFWSREDVVRTLCQALEFMTGDHAYHFTFLPGHATPPTSLFDSEDFEIPLDHRASAVLPFSGGLDSLAGALHFLEQTDQRVCLVSHQSQSGIKRTQHQLVCALRRKFDAQRVLHYRFECNLRGPRAPEETQRTRALLFTSIAFAVACSLGASRIHVFENGVTGVNFARRQDLSNARASRTTHPKTVALLAKFFSLVAEESFVIELPFLWHTKADVLRRLLHGSMPELLSSAISCSRTIKADVPAPQCGECFQCIDRRVAAHAAGIEQIDHGGLYANDVISQPFQSGESRTTAVDYVRLAMKFANWSADRFQHEMVAELAEVVDFLPDVQGEIDGVEQIWGLCRRHGKDVEAAIRRMRELYDSPYEPVADGSLLQLVAGREYLKPEVNRLVESLASILRPGISAMFRFKRPPKDELDLNLKIHALLKTHHDAIRSEHPSILFACAKVVPDHELPGTGLLIEAKYIRDGTPPSKATEGIAADLTKYPSHYHVLFVVYDPACAIRSDEEYTSDIESKGRNTVLIIR